jgi:hypothetical protein
MGRQQRGRLSVSTRVESGKMSLGKGQRVSKARYPANFVSGIEMMQMNDSKLPRYFSYY